MKDNMIETAVGAVVILIAGLFFAFAYTTSGVGKAQGGLPCTVILNANGDVIAQYLGKLKEDQIKSWPSLAA